MGREDPRIDAYIAQAAPFAQPILRHLRKLVHTACPEVEETVKWGMPFFDYKGMLCHMAAFKQHCAFGFRNDSVLPEKLRSAEAMGNFGRLTSVADLPADKVLISYVRNAAQSNDAGVKRPRGTRSAPKPPPPVPAEFAMALKLNRKTQGAFESLSPSHRREYIEWITEAKRDATRESRIAKALEWIAEGKARR